MSTCTDRLQRAGVEISGFNKADVATAVCAASRYCKSYAPGSTDIRPLLKTILGSQFGDRLSKAVTGGLQHVISVDNAAGYAELWYKGGSWYAVTGASLDKSTSQVEKGGIYEIAGVTKGMPLAEASVRFLEAVYGPSRFDKGCGCGR